VFEKVLKNNITIQSLALSLVFVDLLATEAGTAEIKPALSFELTGGSKYPRAIVFSKDLKWLATCLRSGKVEVWNVNQYSRVAEWQTAAVESSIFAYLRGESPIAFLSNSTELLVAVGTNVVVHESLTGNVIRTLESPPAKVAAITLSPGGTRVVGAMDNFRQAIFWNPSDGKIMSHLPTKPDPREMGMPRRWRDPATGKVKLPVSITPGGCRAFDRNGDRFAAGLVGGGGQVDIWNLESGKCLDTLQTTLSGSSHATRLAFLTGQRLAAVFDQQQLTILALNTNASTTLIPHPLNTHSNSLEIRSLAVSGDDMRLAVAGMRMGKRPGVWAPKGDMVFDVPMHGEAQVWDAVGMKLLVTIKGMPSEKFSHVALDDSGQCLIVVTTGVEYNPRMSTPMQDSQERAPKKFPRVSVWELPVR
jgi:WD40 repeat protein